MSTDPKKAQKGDYVAHRSGDISQLGERKPDDSGWWIADGGGLADGVLNGPDWVLLDKPTIAKLFEGRAS